MCGASHSYNLITAADQKMENHRTVKRDPASKTNNQKQAQQNKCFPPNVLEVQRSLHRPMTKETTNVKYTWVSS